MFDPTLPLENTIADAAQMRSQLNGLKDLIAAVPTISSAVVDAVNTLPAGDLASVGVTVTDGVLHLTFGIPEGQSGPPGEVTQAELDDAITAALAQASNNTNAVNTLDTAFSNDPPTLADLEVLRLAYNDLVLALRR